MYPELEQDRAKCHVEGQPYTVNIAKKPLLANKLNMKQVINWLQNRLTEAGIHDQSDVDKLIADVKL